MRKNDENIDIRSKSAKRLDRILMSLLLGSIITVAVGTGIFINKQVSNIEDDINESKQNFNTFVVEQNLKDEEQDEKISDLKQKTENFDVSISLNDTYVADSGLKEGTSSNYIVKTGDTLSEIVFDKYGRYSLNAIKAVAYLNNISNVNRIWAGQSLIIPTQEQIEQLRMNGDLDFYVDSWVMDKVEEAPVEKGIIFRTNPFIEEEVAEDTVSVAEENQVESVKSRVSDEPELVVNNMFEEFTPAEEITEPVAEEVVEEAPVEEISEPVAEEVVEETAPAVEEEAVVEEVAVEEISEPVAEEVVEETTPAVEETLNFDLLKEYFDDGDNYIPTLNTENIDDMFKLESEFMKGFLLSESMNNISEEQELVEETAPILEEEAVVEEAPTEKISEPVAEEVVEETTPAVEEEAVVEEAPTEEISEPVAEEVVEETAPAVEEEAVVEEVPAEEVSEAVVEEVPTEEVIEPVIEENTNPIVEEIEDIVVENDEYMNNFYNSTNYIGFKEDEGLEEHLIEMQRKSEMEKIKKSHEKEVFTNLFEKTR